MEERPTVNFEHLADAAFTAVLRALDARELVAEKRPRPIRGPILVGIIAWPERLPGEVPLTGADLHETQQ